MEITHHEETAKGRFEAKTDGDQLGEMTYSKAGEHKIIIDHTGVEAKAQGQGVGEALVQAAVDLARERKIKIMPLCPFAAALFKKHPEWSDLL